jgi:hypothetical protein
MLLFGVLNRASSLDRKKFSSGRSVGKKVYLKSKGSAA